MNITEIFTSANAVELLGYGLLMYWAIEILKRTRGLIAATMKDPEDAD